MEVGARRPGPSGAPVGDLCVSPCPGFPSELRLRVAEGSSGAAGARLSPQVHLQTQQQVKLRMTGLALRVVRSDGLLALYNGLSASLCRQVLGLPLPGRWVGRAPALSAGSGPPLRGGETEPREGNPGLSIGSVPRRPSHLLTLGPWEGPSLTPGP